MGLSGNVGGGGRGADAIRRDVGSPSGSRRGSVSLLGGAHTFSTGNIGVQRSSRPSTPRGSTLRPDPQFEESDRGSDASSALRAHDELSSVESHQSDPRRTSIYFAQQHQKSRTELIRENIGQIAPKTKATYLEGATGGTVSESLAVRTMEQVMQDEFMGQDPVSEALLYPPRRPQRKEFGHNSTVLVANLGENVTAGTLSQGWEHRVMWPCPFEVHGADM